MKIVIQCAGRKTKGAATLRAADGRSVRFVAQPHLAPAHASEIRARPDDVSDDGRTWRARLLAYNEQPDNPLDLLPAYRLYGDDVYRELVGHFGAANVFILSAGWGLIPSTFLTPAYDITFSTQGDLWTRRRDGDRYDDVCLMPDDGDEIVFLDNRGYRSLFCALTEHFRGSKRVYFKTAVPPQLPPGFTTIRYETRRVQNWQYEATRALIAGSL